MPSPPPISIAFQSEPGSSRRMSPAAARGPDPARSPRQARRPLKPRKEIQRKTASAGRRSRGSAPSTGRGSGFTQSEVDSLLELLLEHLPLCREEWETVLRLHLERYPGVERTVDSLKRKFGALYRKRVPTGDPHIPPEVEKAKLVRQRMTERADIGDGELTEDFLEESIPDEASGARVAPMFWTEEDRDGSELHSTCAEEEGEGNEIAVGQVAVQPNDVEDGGVGAAPTVNARSVSPRPLVRKRSRFQGGSQKSADEDLVALIQMSLLQEQNRRADEQSQREQDRIEERQRREQDRIDERERRAEERRRREEERARREEERLRREAEARRHEQFMQLMMLSLSQSSKQSQNSQEPGSS